LEEASKAVRGIDKFGQAAATRGTHWAICKSDDVRQKCLSSSSSSLVSSFSSSSSVSFLFPPFSYYPSTSICISFSSCLPILLGLLVSLAVIDCLVIRHVISEPGPYLFRRGHHTALTVFLQIRRKLVIVGDGMSSMPNELRTLQVDQFLLLALQVPVARHPYCAHLH
jgi:hypothetical protein